eukprot:s11808_g1.t1
MPRPEWIPSGIRQRILICGLGSEIKVTVYGACFCCFNGLNLENVEIGCAAKDTLLCLEWDFCLKSGTEKPHGHWMKFSPLPVLPESGSEAACRCGTASDNEVVPGLCAQLIPTVCTKPPWRAEVPMMLSVCFLVCFPKFGFFKKISEIKG